MAADCHMLRGCPSTTQTTAPGISSITPSACFPGKAELVAAAVANFATLWGTPDDAQWPQSLEIRNRFLQRWRHLIGAPAGTMTTAENVTTALHSLIGALPGPASRRPQTAHRRGLFPEPAFPAGRAWRSAADSSSARCRCGPARPGCATRISSRIGARTSAWRCSPGSRPPPRIAAICARWLEHGRAMGSLVGADITQGVGIVPFDLPHDRRGFRRRPARSSGCAAFPAPACCRCASALLKECRPELRGWFSQENIFSWELDSFAYASDARRFDHGTPSILAVRRLPARARLACATGSRLAAVPTTAGSPPR